MGLTEGGRGWQSPGMERKQSWPVRGIACAVWMALAAVPGRAAVLDVEALERDVRRDVEVFGVATGAEGAVLSQETLVGMDADQVRALAEAVRGADGELALALYGELGRRELPWADRLGVLQDLLYWTEFSPRREETRAAAKAWGEALWEAWKAGEIPEECRREAMIGLWSFCRMEWFRVRGVLDGAEDRDEGEPTEETKVWEERTEELWEALEELEEELQENQAPAVEGREENAGESGGSEPAGADGGEGGREPGCAAEWHFRRGMEMSGLGRKRDAAAEWGEAERLAQEEGNAALAQEVRAARAVYGDWRWRRAERRALCEAELAAGSPWREHLLDALAEEAEQAGDWPAAAELAMEGWWRYGGGEWAARVGRTVSKGGGEDLELWHRVCGERLEEIPAVEERREEIRALVEFRWAVGVLFPERVEASLEGDLARVRERAEGEGNEMEERAGSAGRDGRKVEVPGARWKEGESWRRDPAVAEIEREFNEILLTPPRWRAVDAWASWREKWSEEERRALVVDGVEAEFVSWVDEFVHANWSNWPEQKPIGLRALEEAKGQERYDAGRFLDVLWKLVMEAMVEGPADAAAITEWTDWARRVAAGDAVIEERVALPELVRASWLEDEAAVRRLAGNPRTAAALCQWPYGWAGCGVPWTALARWSGERQTVGLAILHVRMSGEEYGDLAVAALMDAMSVAELEELRGAWRLRALANSAWALERGGAALLASLAGKLGNRREWNWRNAELHLRLARLEAQGADGGAEGQELAVALGAKSVRGTLARLRWRMAGGAESAEDGNVREGRWREWCECVRRLATDTWEGGRNMSANDREGYHSFTLPPWMDRFVQGRLAEALSLWGADATEGERAGIAAALGWMGCRAGEELYGEWLQAAGAAGAWAVEALETGRERRAKAPELEGEDAGIGFF